MSDRFSGTRQTHAELRAEAKRLRASRTPEVQRRIELSVATFVSARYAAQSESVAQLCVLAMLFGTVEDAAYLARCAAQLARNSLMILETGWTAEEYVDWLEQQRPKTTVSVAAQLRRNNPRRAGSVPMLAILT